MTTALSPTEQQFLTLLTQADGPVKKQDIVDALYGFDPHTNRLNTLVCRMRKKRVNVITHRTVGWSYDPADPTINHE